MKAAHKRTRRWRLPRAEWLGAVTGALALGCMAVLAVLVVDMAQDRRADHAVIDALTRQVEGLGATPVAGPPGSRGEPGASVTGPPGAPGRDGEDGEPGPSGSPGEAGKDGADGSDGVAGEPGAVGASGAAGPAGPPGPQGEPGPAGPQGEAGADGKDGQSCPEGYSLQAPSWDPDALVCRRDGAPDPEPDDGGILGAGALDPNRRQYA